MAIERTEPMKIGASLVVNAIRYEYKTKGMRAALETGRECFPDKSRITDAQIIAIAREEATLRGYSPPGVTYHDEPCKTCKGSGSVLDAAVSKHEFTCPTCKGDGFSPPIVEATP